VLEHVNEIDANPKRVVIIGAGGFVGRHVAQNLADKNIPTVSVTRKEVDLLQSDAQDKLSAILQPEDALVVISAIAPCKSAEQLISNLQMIQPVCEVVRDKAEELSHVVYISSDAVYADDVSLATESSKVEPSSFHGMMHAARELMIKSAAGNMPVAILRPSVLYGAEDPHNGYGPNRFFRLAKDNQNITLFGGGEEQRDHIYIEDVAEVVAQTLLHRSKGTLNIATGKSISFREIADKVVEIAKSAAKVEPTDRKNPITHRHFDVTACRKAFPSFNYTAIEIGLTKWEK